MQKNSSSGRFLHLNLFTDLTPSNLYILHALRQTPISALKSFQPHHRAFVYIFLK